MTRYEIFYGESTPGFIKSGTKTMSERVRNAHDKAEAWIAANPQAEIISISNGSAQDGSTFGWVFVSVWYRTP